MNPKSGRGIRRAHRVVRDSVVIKVARLAICRDVLTEQSILALNRGNGPKDLDL